MKSKPALRDVLIRCIFVCITMCLMAQLLVILQGRISHFSLSRFLMNFGVAYPIAVIASFLIPAPAFSNFVCAKLRIMPGLLYRIFFTLTLNLLYTLILSSAMTFFNIVCLEGGGPTEYFYSLAGSFIPMWLISALVSVWITEPLMRLLHRVSKSRTDAL